jgi:thiopeptide-type bacteriocin biosynthesis protein
LDPHERIWRSEYLFFNGHIYSGECDRVVFQVMEPFVRRCQAEGWIDQWFFIRYSERGFHVRLRLHGERATLENVVAPALRAHVESIDPGIVEDFPLPPFVPPAGQAAGGDGPAGEQAANEPAPSAAQGGPALPEGEPGRVTHLMMVEYEPETERYGGPEGVRLAERFFEVSSEATLALLQRGNAAERSSRLGKGLLAMVVLVHVFRGDRDGGADFARQYGLNYLRTLVPDEERRSAWLGAFGSGFEQQAETLSMYVEEVWSRMDEGESLSEALDRYHADLLPIRDHFRELLETGRLGRAEMPFRTWEHAVAGIVSSYVHMMNNRLGISIQEESYLAYLMVRALGKAVEAPAASSAPA